MKTVSSCLLGFGLLLLSACQPPVTSPDVLTPGDTNSGDSTTSNPVVGTWLRDSDYGSSRRVLTIVLNANNTLTSNEVFTVMATTTATNAGCSATRTYTGTWSTAGTNLTVQATTGTAVITGCNDTTMNSASRAANTDEIMLFNSTSAFSITGNMLTFSSFMDPAPFTRQ